MRSRWSFPLFRAFGVQVRSDLFLAALVVGELIRGLRLGQAVPVAEILAVLLVSIVLHEFGHVFAARRMGGSGDEIILGPLGGAAAVDAPHAPKAQFWTASGGLIVNLALALLAAAWMRLSGLSPLASPSWTQPWAAMFLQVNAALFLFNLLPAFPMDGGRMLQAACWPRMGYVRSMRLALGLGVLAAFLIGVAGVAWREWMLLAIAVTNFLACERERQALSDTESWGEPDFVPREPSASPGWLERIRRARRERERQRREAREARLRTRVDAILEKINHVGMQGLSPEERATLKEASDVFKHSRK